MVDSKQSGKKEGSEGITTHRPNSPWKGVAFYGSIVLGICAFLVNYSPISVSFSRSEPVFVESTCPPPLPTIFAKDPPSSSHGAIRLASKSFEKALSRIYRQNDIDSLAVAVITSAGSVYEGFHGPLRANESSTHPRLVDRHSIFRIASISKVFACMETLILRDRGVLSLDDPISKFIPVLDYKTQGRSLSNKDKEVITLRQLMSHMAGLLREHPSDRSPRQWPAELGSGDPPTFITNAYTTTEELIQGISESRLIMSPNKFPSYSNAGFSLLGAAILAAARSVEGHSAPGSYAELIKRDIIDKLGLKDNSFLAGESNQEHLVVPSQKAFEVDLDFGADNPTGGQMSSIADFVAFARGLLDPNTERSLLSPVSLEELFKSVYTFVDGVTSVGIPWEISRTSIGYGRSIEEFSKAGALSSQFSSFSFIPSHSFAIAVLTAGNVNKALEIHRLAMDYFLPAFDKALIDMTARHLAGMWKNDNSSVELHIEMLDAALYATYYFVNGINALISLNGGQKTDRVPIWSLGNDEFRLRPVLLGNVGTSCYSSWMNLDEYTYMNGYAVNLIRLLPRKIEPEKNQLEVPALQITLSRG